MVENIDPKVDYVKIKIKNLNYNLNNDDSAPIPRLCLGLGASGP
jgi:hypothetical protein